MAILQKLDDGLSPAYREPGSRKGSLQSLYQGISGMCQFPELRRGIRLPFLVQNPDLCKFLLRRIEDSSDSSLLRLGSMRGPQERQPSKRDDQRDGN